MPGTADRQSNYPCPKCGSWYRSGKRCNVCDAKLPDDKVVPDKTFLKKPRLKKENRSFRVLNFVF